MVGNDVEKGFKRRRKDQKGICRVASAVPEVVETALEVGVRNGQGE